jgi:transporter family-2 protein
MTILFALIGIIVGIMLGNMTPINADLTKKVKSPYFASAISLFFAALILLIVALVTKTPLLPGGSAFSSIPPILFLGGLIGAVYVTSNILMFPRIGAVETVALPLVGQILAGIFFDTFGLFNTAKIPFGLLRLLGIVLLIVGLWFSLNDKNTIKTTKHVWGWRIFAIFIGAIAAFQQTLNGGLGANLAKFLGSGQLSLIKGSIQGSLFAFTLGFIVSLIVAIIKEKKILPSSTELKTLRPINILGGIFNAFVGLGRMFLRSTLPQTFVVALVDLGQIAAGLLVQGFGLWNSPKRKVTGLQIGGLIVMFIGVLFIIGFFH